WIMPASKDTRVRVDAFLKIMPSTRVFRGSLRMPRLGRALSSMAGRSSPVGSAGVHAISERRCRALIVVTLITFPGLWRRSANVRKGDLGEVAGATKWKGSDVIGKYRSRANCPVRRARSIAVPRDVAKKYA